MLSLVSPWRRILQPTAQHPMPLPLLIVPMLGELNPTTNTNEEPLLSLMNDSDTIKLLVTDLAIFVETAKREPGIDEKINYWSEFYPDMG